MNKWSRFMNKWTVVENWLKNVAFKDMTRKNGAPMYLHSVDVGRRLQDMGADDVTVFAGYCHDVEEDCSQEVNNELEKFVKQFFNESECKNVLELVHMCSYSPYEYNIEKVLNDEGENGKDERKRLATQRWLNSNNDKVWKIKLCDVRSNQVTAPLVSEKFNLDYNSWAAPFADEIERRLEMRL